MQHAVAGERPVLVEPLHRRLGRSRTDIDIPLVGAECRCHLAQFIGRLWQGHLREDTRAGDPPRVAVGLHGPRQTGDLLRATRREGCTALALAGEVATLLGRNGMGKTTTVSAITGVLESRQGEVSLEGRRIDRLASHVVARLGLGLVPEGRQIFPNLTVRENLVATAANRNRRPDPWTLARVYALFPRLAERHTNMGNQLSGGEQQMLAIGRALMTNPKLLILDEATEGLAPLIRTEIWSCLEGLKRSGLSILVIDKNLAPMIRLVDRHHIIEKGRIVWSGTSTALRGDAGLQRRYLGV
jgi:branched-chain amino acid transport system ATP-binding protein